MQGNANDESTRALVEFLSNPATYPGHPAVEFVETHISLVFLAGNEVYKLKKPVKFDFLDFSTVEKRKRACQAEVRLNRRMAASVYLGTCPIRRTPQGGLRIGGPESAKVVDWLVHMRRLDADRTFTERLRNSDENAKSLDIQTVAEFLATFFAAQAPVTVKTETFLDDLRNHVLGNQTQLLELAPAAEHDRIRRVHTSQLRFLTTHRDLFESRVLDGRIVDGHGDLRPDHIYLYKTPWVIDCIEFHPEYRTNDVIDELAFLAVCCDRLGEPAVGHALFEAYRRCSGDVCNLDLITFYRAYRACVRAKVAGLRSQQVAIPRDDDSLQRKHGYLKLADRYAQSLEHPFALIVGGRMGSGKTTLSKRLQETLSAELVSTDAVRTPALKTETADRSASSEYGRGEYSRASRMANYDRLVSRAVPLVRRNAGIIFDATFTMRAARQRVVDFAHSLGLRVLQVECECPREEAIHRIQTRAREGNSDSKALPEHYDQQVAEAESPLAAIRLLRVNTMWTLAEQESAVIKQLSPMIANDAASDPSSHQVERKYL